MESSLEVIAWIVTVCGILFAILSFLWRLRRLQHQPFLWKLVLGLSDIAHFTLGVGCLVTLLSTDESWTVSCKMAGFFTLYGIQDSLWTGLITHAIFLAFPFPLMIASNKHQAQFRKHFLLLFVLPQKLVQIFLAILPITPLEYFEQTTFSEIKCLPLRGPYAKGSAYFLMLVVMLLVASTVTIVLATAKLCKIHTAKKNKIQVSSLVTDTPQIPFLTHVVRLSLIVHLLWFIVVLLVTLNLYSESVSTSDSVTLLLALCCLVHAGISQAGNYIGDTIKCCGKYGEKNKMSGVRVLKKLEYLESQSGVIRMKSTWINNESGEIQEGLLKVYQPDKLNLWAQEIVVLGLLRRQEFPALLRCLWTESMNPYNEAMTLITGKGIEPSSRLICVDILSLGNLHSLLHVLQTPLSDGCLKSLICDIAEGLSHLHLFSVQHNRITSKNIYIRGTLETQNLAAAIGNFEHSQMVSSDDNLPLTGEPTGCIDNPLLENSNTFPSDIRAFALVLLELIAKNHMTKFSRHINIGYAVAHNQQVQPEVNLTPQEEHRSNSDDSWNSSSKSSEDMCFHKDQKVVRCSSADGVGVKGVPTQPTLDPGAGHPGRTHGSEQFASSVIHVRVKPSQFPGDKTEVTGSDENRAIPSPEAKLNVFAGNKSSNENRTDAEKASCTRVKPLNQDAEIQDLPCVQYAVTNTPKRPENIYGQSICPDNLMTDSKNYKVEEAVEKEEEEIPELIEQAPMYAKRSRPTPSSLQTKPVHKLANSTRSTSLQNQSLQPPKHIVFETSTGPTYTQPEIYFGESDSQDKKTESPRNHDFTEGGSCNSESGSSFAEPSSTSQSVGNPSHMPCHKQAANGELRGHSDSCAKLDRQASSIQEPRKEGNSVAISLPSPISPTAVQDESIVDCISPWTTIPSDISARERQVGLHKEKRDKARRRLKKAMEARPLSGLLKRNQVLAKHAKSVKDITISGKSLKTSAPKTLLHEQLEVSSSTEKEDKSVNLGMSEHISASANNMVSRQSALANSIVSHADRGLISDVVKNGHGYTSSSEETIAKDIGPQPSIATTEETVVQSDIHQNTDSSSIETLSLMEQNDSFTNDEGGAICNTKDILDPETSNLNSASLGNTDRSFVNRNDFPTNESFYEVEAKETTKTIKEQPRASPHITAVSDENLKDTSFFPDGILVTRNARCQELEKQEGNDNVTVMDKSLEAKQPNDLSSFSPHNFKSSTDLLLLSRNHKFLMIDDISSESSSVSGSNGVWVASNQHSFARYKSRKRKHRLKVNLNMNKMDREKTVRDKEQELRLMDVRQTKSAPNIARLDWSTTNLQSLQDVDIPGMMISDSGQEFHINPNSKEEIQSSSANSLNHNRQSLDTTSIVSLPTEDLLKCQAHSDSVSGKIRRVDKLFNNARQTRPKTVVVDSDLIIDRIYTSNLGHSLPDIEKGPQMDHIFSPGAASLIEESNVRNKSPKKINYTDIDSSYINAVGSVIKTSRSRHQFAEEATPPQIQKSPHFAMYPQKQYFSGETALHQRQYEVKEEVSYQTHRNSNTSVRGPAHTRASDFGSVYNCTNISEANQSNEITLTSDMPPSSECGGHSDLREGILSHLPDGINAFHIKQCQKLSNRLQLVMFDDLIPVTTGGIRRIRERFTLVNDLSPFDIKMLGLFERCWSRGAPPSAADIVHIVSEMQVQDGQTPAVY